MRLFAGRRIEVTTMSKMSRAIVVGCGALLVGAGYGHVQAARPSADDLQPVASHEVRMPAVRLQQAQSSSPAASPASLDHGAVLKDRKSVV